MVRIRSRYLEPFALFLALHTASLKNSCCEICAANLVNHGFDADAGLPFGLDRDQHFEAWRCFPQVVVLEDDLQFAAYLLRIIPVLSDVCLYIIHAST